MSIRDIIEATAQVSGKSWTAKHDSTQSWVESESFDIADQVSSQDAEYIATFDPEHQSLIEDEHGAVAGLLAEMERGTKRGGKPHAAMTALRCCHERLTAYRREKGLEPAKEVAE